MICNYNQFNEEEEEEQVCVEIKQKRCHVIGETLTLRFKILIYYSILHIMECDKFSVLG